MSTITRIPPSPTGMFHVGSLRTALYDYLLAKKAGGKFLLRIEDTDRARLVDGSLENIIESLYWAGIVPDEGIMLDNDRKIIEVGSDGPYVQSNRLNIYEKYIQQLLDAGQAYYAFDSSEELDEMRKIQQLNKRPPRYEISLMKNEFTIGKEESKKLVDSGSEYVVRLVVPENEDISFVDLVRGGISFNTREVDDQILRKSDGFPTYHLAVVVDDYHMKVTHILRGEEWISSTPKHILLYRYFGWKLPKFGHLPLLVNEKGAKLGKRHGDVSVFDFKDKGYLPEAMVNFVALLGWNPGTEQEIFSLSELVGAFDINKVQKKPAFFDRVKLDWFNQQWIRKIDISDLAKRCTPYLVKAGFIDEEEIKNNELWLQKVVELERERMTVLSDLPAALGFVFELPDYETGLLVWKKSDANGAKDKLSLLKEILVDIEESRWDSNGLNDIVFPWIKENDYGVGDVMWPMRVALSGQINSPGPFDIAGVLGKSKSLERIDIAISKL